MSGGGTLLVVGGGHAEIPLIQAAQALGHRVVTTGNRPDDLGHAHADAYAPADFSRPDEILDVAVAHGVDAIVSGCNDFALLSTVYACEQLGLPGHDSFETSVRIHHKDRFRSLLEELGLGTPRATVITDAATAVARCDELGYPLIVKPVDLTGGKGVQVCDSPEQLVGAVEHALSLTRQEHVVVEQFMAGTRHGFTCFVTGGRVGFWFADDEQYFRNQYLVSGTVTPTSMPASAIETIVREVEVITRALELVDGLMHVQCILTAAGPRIVELCRRCPGDLYPTFVRLATGYDYAGSVVRSELGLGPLPVGPHVHLAPVARHCLMADREGVLRDIRFDDDVRAHLTEQMLWWSPGQVIDQHLTQKFGIVFLGFDDAGDMRRLVDELPSRISIELA